MHLRLSVYGFLQTSSSSEDAVENRINQIIELDESRRQACEQNYRNQEKVKRAFDKTTRQRVFSIGDIVLLWDKRREKPGKHGKFDSLWLGPFVIRDVAGPNSSHLSHLNGEPMNLPMNGQQLKIFFK